MRIGGWAVTLGALLAMFSLAEFGYAQLRQLSGWPLDLLVSSTCSWVAGSLAADCASAVHGLVPVAITGVILLVVAGSSSNDRAPAEKESSGGTNREE